LKRRNIGEGGEERRETQPKSRQTSDDVTIVGKRNRRNRQTAVRKLLLELNRALAKDETHKEYEGDRNLCSSLQPATV
jgi:hypothetical protein